MGLFSGFFDRSFKMRDLKQCDPKSRSWINHIDETKEFVKETKTGYLYLAELMGYITVEETFNGIYDRVSDTENTFEEALENEEDKNLVLFKYANFLSCIESSIKNEQYDYVHEKNLKGVKIGAKLLKEGHFLDSPILYSAMGIALDRAARIYEDKKFHDYHIELIEFAMKNEGDLKIDVGGRSSLFHAVNTRIFYSPNREDEYPDFYLLFKLDPIEINKTFLECINTSTFELSDMTRASLLAGYGAHIMHYADTILREMTRNYKTEEFDESVALEVVNLAEIATEWFDESLKLGFIFYQNEQSGAMIWTTNYERSLNVEKEAYVEYRKNGTLEKINEKSRHTSVEATYTSIPEILRVKDVLKNEE